MKLSAATPRPSSRELTHKSGPPEPSTLTRPKTGQAGVSGPTAHRRGVSRNAQGCCNETRVHAKAQQSRSPGRGPGWLPSSRGRPNPRSSALGRAAAGVAEGPLRQLKLVSRRGQPPGVRHDRGLAPADSFPLTRGQRHAPVGHETRARPRECERAEHALDLPTAGGPCSPVRRIPRPAAQGAGCVTKCVGCDGMPFACARRW